MERVSAKAQVSESECAFGGEEALCDAERSKEAATSRQGEGAEPDAADTAGTAEARSELETGEAAPRPGLADPMTLEKPTAMVFTSSANTESWAASWRSASTRGHVTTESTNQKCAVSQKQ